MPRPKSGKLPDQEKERFRIPVPFEPPIFDGSSSAALDYLEEYGYVVLKVLTDAEVASAEATFWREAGAAFGWVEGMPQTWMAAERWSTMANRADCGHLRGWDYSKFRWEIFKNKRVQTAFADVCQRFAGASKEEVKDLLASFNSVNVFRPHLSPFARPGWRTTAEPWYHVDNRKPKRGSLRGQRVVFPGVINLEPVDSESGGFVCVPKSHLLFSDGPAAREGESDTYLEIQRYTNYVYSEPNERVGNKTHTQPILVCTGQQRGTLLIWDPRLVHCSTSSLGADEANVRATKPRLLRLANFVSLCPRAWSTYEDRAARVALVEQRQCINSHIPYAVTTQRRVLSAAFYEGLWEDEECLRMIGADSAMQSQRA